ncbi:hypothetical protein HOLleu_08091 [Holothuria leucospilota]|uniref:Uncharacterized protein n=1 Tax=Holothuria leucospilota TaxID=206669 RepID=A0A9Q1HHK3_HOLLE|nr:hypothetical protein HOLleu_08091 [Holothuria leucospilota]
MATGKSSVKSKPKPKKADVPLHVAQDVESLIDKRLEDKLGPIQAALKSLLAAQVASADTSVRNHLGVKPPEKEEVEVESFLERSFDHLGSESKTTAPDLPVKGLVKTICKEMGKALPKDDFDQYGTVPELDPTALAFLMAAGVKKLTGVPSELDSDMLSALLGSLATALVDATDLTTRASTSCALSEGKIC